MDKLGRFVQFGTSSIRLYPDYVIVPTRTKNKRSQTFNLISDFISKQIQNSIQNFNLNSTSFLVPVGTHGQTW